MYFDCSTIKIKIDQLLQIWADFNGVYSGDLDRDQAKVLIEMSEQIRDLMNEIENSIHISIDEFIGWLQENNLEDYLEGGSFEKLMAQQESFYQEYYGHNFELLKEDFEISRRNLPAIKKGLENGCLNYPFFYVFKTYPMRLITDAEAENVRKNFSNCRLKLRRADDANMTGYNSDEMLRKYLPVDLADFNAEELARFWEGEISRICQRQKPEMPVKSKKQLIFTDFRESIPADQPAINIAGDIIRTKDKSFINMIRNNVDALTPAQWLMLAYQKYSSTGGILGNHDGGGDPCEWMMAVIKHRPDKEHPPVSVAMALPSSFDVWFDVSHAHAGDPALRWRSAIK